MHPADARQVDKWWGRTRGELAPDWRGRHAAAPRKGRC